MQCLHSPVVVEQIGHLDFSVAVHLHLQDCTAVFKFGASCSVGGELHIFGVHFDFGSQIGVANSAGEVACYGFHKLGYGGGSGGVGGEFGYFDFSTVDVFGSEIGGGV